MTTQPLNVNQATNILRDRDYTVKAHGARFLASHGDTPPAIFTEAELIRQADNASRRAPDAGEAPLMTVAELDAAPLLPGDTLPLMDLLGALEDHKRRIGPTYPTTMQIPLPLGLPSRLSVPHSLVKPGRYQPRTQFDATELQELADSIAEHGILNPLIVFANEHGAFELIAGERRLRAAALAGLTLVPIEIKALSLRQIFEISGLDNIQRAQLSAVEEGRYYNRAIDELQISEAELSRRLSKNRAYIQQRRALASAAPEVIAALESGVLTFSQARAIAQAAPGQAKTQAAALKLLADKQRVGQRVTEDDAKSTTEKLVRKAALSDLAALGWKLTPDGEVYSDAVRPTKWSGAEMIAAVEAQKRPSGDAIGVGCLESDMWTIGLKYGRVVKDAAPWIGLATGWGAPIAYYAPSELAQVAAEIQTEWDALVARAAQHGWKLKASESGYINHTLLGPNGGQDRAYSWDNTVNRVERIESGELTDVARPIVPTASMPRSLPPTCEVCGTSDPAGYAWHDNKRYCHACIEPFRAAEQQRTAAALATVDAAIGAWLRSAPAGAIPLLVGAISGKVCFDVHDAAWLLAQIAETVASNPSGEDYEEAPSVARLLGLASAEPTAMPAGALADDLVAANSPLWDIAGAVYTIGTWMAENPLARADEIEVNIAELRVLSDDLDTFSGDDAVDDREWEALSHAIGQLTRDLRALLKEQAVGT